MSNVCVFFKSLSYSAIVLQLQSSRLEAPFLQLTQKEQTEVSTGMDDESAARLFDKVAVRAIKKRFGGWPEGESNGG